MDDYDYLAKIVLIGDSGVGKSSAMYRFVDEMFSESFISTIGVDFKIKTVHTLGKKVKLQIWDTAGQEKFRTITTSYYRGAHAILVFFDLTDLASFEHIKLWLDEIDRYIQGGNNPVVMLVGTKADLTNVRMVHQEKIDGFCKERNLECIITSARDGTNINQLFERIAMKIIATSIIKPSQSGDKKPITLTPTKPVNPAGYCNC